MNITFKRNRSAVTGHGQRFEINVAFLLLLKGLQRKNKFNLCCNIDGFGNFDDVVFKYKLNDEYHLLLLQLKHKRPQDSSDAQKSKAKDNNRVDNNQTQINTQLNLDWKLLLQCYNSYLQIETYYNKKKAKKNEILKDVKEDNIHYIIFTNERFLNCSGIKYENEESIIDYLSTNADEESSKPIQLNNDQCNQCIAESFKYFANADIFQGEKSKLLTILQKQKDCGEKTADDLKKHIAQADEEKILNLLDNTDIQNHFDKRCFINFLTKLIIFQKQPDEDSLSEFLQDEIADIGEEDSKRAYDEIAEKMRKWHENSNVALTQNNFYEILEKDGISNSSFLSELNFNENAYVPRTITNRQRDIKIDNTCNPEDLPSKLILAGDPGEGKSVITNYLSNCSKRNMKLIKINLANLSLKLSKNKNIKIKEDDSSENIFRKIIKYKNKQKYRRINKETFYIIFDGYDEVAFRGDEIIKQVDDCIQILARKFKMLVSTRLSFETKLAKLINGSIYHIKKLDSAEQKKIAKNFCQIKDIDVQSIDDIFKLSEIMDLGTFLAVPLQLEMLLEVFVDEFLSAGETEGVSFQFKNIYDFYEKFVNKKIDIYLERANLQNAHNNWINETKEKIFSDHYRYALNVLGDSSEEPFNFTLTANELIEIGFVKDVNFDKQSITLFLHQTFAEYFYALGLLNYSRKYEIEIIKFINRNDFLGEYLNSKLVSQSEKEFNLVNDDLAMFKKPKIEWDVLGRTPLHIAITKGAKKISKYLIENKKYMNEQDCFGDTPLHCAIKFSEYDIASELIRNECKINLTNNRNETCLHNAVSRGGNTDIIRLIISKPECDIDCKNYRNETALDVAINNNDSDIVEFLISKCNIFTRARDISTELHDVSENGLIERVKLIISQPTCDINCRDFLKRTPLHLAVINKNAEIAKLLIENENCNVNVRDRGGRTALHYASDNGLTEIVKLIISQPTCNINCQDNLRVTALHLAIRNKNVEIANLLLLNKNCNVDIRDEDRRTALHYVSKYGLIGIIKLITCKANWIFNWRDYRGCTPLHLAIKNKNTEIAKFLIYRDYCDYTVKDRDGKTALEYASEYGLIEIVEFIISKSNRRFSCKKIWNCTALHLAIKNNNTEMAILLLTSQFCCVNVRDEDGRTALHYASEYGLIKIVELIISEPNCDINCEDNLNRTALHLALIKKKVEIAKLLVSNENCDVTVKDEDGETALHYASNNGLTEMVKLIISKPNCDINCEDNLKCTALQLAIKNKNVEIVALLESHGKKTTS